ncbi:hypothetical protein [Nesterenkonia rhizosphaerae]|uniref:Uncharacterized protein n=1 Tax=Nesterenkonia rhizosphaerae TaxID=1348272 RepID=A0ABP9FU30_9MICC
MSLNVDTIQQRDDQFGLTVWIDKQAYEQLSNETLRERHRLGDDTIFLETMAAVAIFQWCDDMTAQQQ